MKIIVPVVAGALLLGSALTVSADSGKGGPDRLGRARVFTKKIEVTTGPRLGVQVTAMTPELRAYFQAPSDAGVLVGKVEDGSPAARAGVRVGDVIVSVGGERVEDSMEILAALASRKAGDSVTVEVVREKRPLTLTAKLDEKWIGGSQSWESGDPGDLDFDFDWPHGKGLRMFSFGFGEERLEKLEARIHELEERLEKMERKQGK